MTSRTDPMASAVTPCPQCHEANSRKALFCAACRYPIGVKNLAHLNASDLMQSLGFLTQVLAETTKPIFKDKALNALYDRFWNLYWLRPERALFRFTEAALLRRLLRRRLFRTPFLDLGCGDGLFTATLFGATTTPTGDAFVDLDFQQADAFNSQTSTAVLASVVRPGACGVDLKAASANRAVTLGFYDQVATASASTLPFKPASFASVFSNMLDDVRQEELAPVLREANRVLRRKGTLVFTTPAARFRDHLFFFPETKRARSKGDVKRAEFLEGLDRGRSHWEPRSAAFWRSRLRAAGFRIVHSHGYATAPLMRLWDTGFRPFFPALVSAKETLARAGFLAEAKPLIVDILKGYFARFITLSPQPKGAFTLLVAQKEKEAYAD